MGLQYGGIFSEITAFIPLTSTDTIESCDLPIPKEIRGTHNSPHPGHGY
jgi:hypothetical protein